MPYNKLKSHLCNSHMSGTDFIFQKCLVSKSTVLAPNLPIFNTSLASPCMLKSVAYKRTESFILSTFLHWRVSTYKILLVLLCSLQWCVNPCLSLSSWLCSPAVPIPDNTGIAVKFTWKCCYPFCSIDQANKREGYVVVAENESHVSGKKGFWWHFALMQKHVMLWKCGQWWWPTKSPWAGWLSFYKAALSPNWHHHTVYLE